MQLAPILGWPVLRALPRRAIFLDIQGVLVEDCLPIAGAFELVLGARQRRVVIRLVTNTATKDNGTIHAELRQVGFVLIAAELFTAPVVACHCLQFCGSRRGSAELCGARRCSRRVYRRCAQPGFSDGSAAHVTGWNWPKSLFLGGRPASSHPMGASWSGMSLRAMCSAPWRLAWPAASSRSSRPAGKRPGSGPRPGPRVGQAPAAGN